MRAFTLVEEADISPRQLPTRALLTMRTSRIFLPLICYILTAYASAKDCGSEPSQNGCKIYGKTCVCGYGCRLEFIFPTKRDCRNALRAATAPPPMSLGHGGSSNICNNAPCLRGTCLQTSNEPGYTCKCEGTGFYGQRCEKGCPTDPVYGMAFPHECVVI